MGRNEGSYFVGLCLILQFGNAFCSWSICALVRSGLPVLYLSQRHWLFGSRRQIETQDILGLLANPEFDNSQSGGHMMVGSFLDHD
jgi:hypothetical protein